MTIKEKYIRRYIILNNYSKYFNDENKRVKGYGILEIREGKGKISLNVEGFKHQYKNKIYKMYLLGESNRGLIEVDAGPIRIRDDGKSQLDWKFNPRDLGNTGLPLEKFNTIMIRLCNIDKQLDEEIIIPLAGFIDKKGRDILDIAKELKNNKDNKDLNKLNKNKYNASNLNKPCEIEEEILEENVKNKDEENRKDKRYVDSKNNELHKKDKDNGNIKKITTDEKEKTETIEKQKEEKQKQEQDEKLQSVSYEEQNNERCKDTKQYNKLFNNVPYYGQNIDQYNNQVASYTLNVLKFFEEVDPLKEKLEGYNWWEIPYDRRNIYRGFLPYYNYVINVYQQYPFITRSATCQGLIKKYRHYIFGIAKKDDKVKYYIYGIPGKFTRLEHPYNGLTGFTTWYQSSNSINEKNGYWLLYIDAASGKIITPKKPMIPY